MLQPANVLRQMEFRRSGILSRLQKEGASFIEALRNVEALLLVEQGILPQVLGHISPLHIEFDVGQPHRFVLGAVEQERSILAFERVDHEPLVAVLFLQRRRAQLFRPQQILISQVLFHSDPFAARIRIVCKKNVHVHTRI